MKQLITNIFSQRDRYQLLIALTLLLCLQTFAEGTNLDSLLNELKIAKEDTNKVNILNSLSWELRNSEPDKAMNYGKQALKIALKLAKSPDYAKGMSGKEGIANSYNNIGFVHSGQGNYEKAIMYYQKSLKIKEELSDSPNEALAQSGKRGMGISYNNIGTVHLYQGNYDKAIKYYQKYLKICEETGDKKGIGIAYHNIGNVHIYQGSYEKAIMYYQKSLKICEELGDKIGMGLSLVNIGTVHKDQGNYEKAIMYYQKSLKLCEELGDKRGMGICFGNIGNVHFGQGNYEKAILYYQKYLKLCEELGDKRGMGMSFVYIGNVYYEQGSSDSSKILAAYMYDKAMEYYQKSLKISEELGDKQEIALILGNIAELNNKQENFHKAIKFAEKSLNISREIGALLREMEAYEHLSTAYEGLNYTGKALEYYKLYTDAKDSLFNEEKNKQITEIETKYETEKKEKEIEILNKDKQILLQDKKLQVLELSKKQKKIVKQRIIIILGFIIFLFFSLLLIIYFRTKEIKKRSFLQQELNKYMQKALSQQMNPHFIFNSLNSIQSYILQNDKRTSNKYLTKFANLMRITLENSQHHTIPIQNELQALNLYLELEALRFKEKFDFTISVDKNIDTLSYKIPTLLIQPYVENAIWHGIMNKETKGKIKIELKLENNTDFYGIVCYIGDNGIGREKAMEIKKKKNQSHQSLGTKIQETRLNLINSLYGSNMNIKYTDLKDENGNAQGTKVELRVPVMN